MMIYLYVLWKLKKEEGAGLQITVLSGTTRNNVQTKTAKGEDGSS